MEKVLVLIIAAFWLSVNFKPSDHKYIFIETPKNWSEALSYCRQTYTDLATIENEDDVKTLNDMLASLKTTSLAWIGLYDDVNSWRWSLSNSTLYQHDEEQFRNWKAGEPNNQYGKESCVSLSTNGFWYDTPCSGQLTTACFNLVGKNITFYYSSVLRTWAEAQSYCRQYYTDLAMVRNLSDNQVLLGLISQSVWIGLYRDTWKWVGGRNSSFRNWNTGEPNNNGGNETCAAAYFGNAGKWQDWNCGTQMTSICYAATYSKHLIKLKLVIPSSLAQDNSAVQKKLKQKLEDDGVKGDIKLSWRKQEDGKIFQKEKKKGEL